MHNSDAWHFAGLVLVIFLATMNGRAGRMGSFWMILFSFPATVLHELSHWLVCLVLGGGPTGFTILPELVECHMEDGSLRKKWRLGSVGISKPGVLSTFPSALAPLLYVPVAFLVYLKWVELFAPSLENTLLMYVSIFLLLSSAVPSGQDIKTAFSNLGSLVMYVGLIAPTVFLWFVF